MPAEAPAAKLHSATWLLVWPAVTVSGVMLHGRLVTCQVEQRAFETLDEWDAVAVSKCAPLPGNSVFGPGAGHLLE
jgi:hypothetical protein